MINSMTGFGSARGSSGALELGVEMKSVNNRFLDCGVKLPRSYSFAEESVKALVQSRLGRGKVDVFISVDSSKEGELDVRINEPLLMAYINAFEEMSGKYGIRNDAGVVAYSRLTDVLVTEKKETDAEVFTEDLKKVTDEALNMLCAMRAAEGERLKADISLKLDEIERLRAAIALRTPKAAAEYTQRLLARMREALQDINIDEGRIVTEAAIFADKTDVDEELVRLGSHISQIRRLLAEGGSVGRKLDFLVQELNREANTIGSKCSDLEITQMVVDLKAEIEKIREQAQNIE